MTQPNKILQSNIPGLAIGDYSQNIPGPTAPLTNIGPGNSGNNETFDTNALIGTVMRNQDNNVRPVAQEIYDLVAPYAAPAVLTDFHGLDLQLAVGASGAPLNNLTSMYALEAKAYHGGTQTLNNVVAALAEADVEAGGTVGQLIGLKTELQVANSSIVTNAWGVYALAPIIDGTSSVTNVYGLYATGYNALTGATLALALYVHDGISRFNDVVQITNDFTAGVGLTVNSGNVINSGQFTALFEGYDYGVKITVSQAAAAGAAKQLLYVSNSANQVFQVLDVGSVIVGPGAALANAAVDGFLYIPTVAGAPTGTPTARTGSVPIVYDTTDDKLYVYRGGAWAGIAI